MGLNLSMFRRDMRRSVRSLQPLAQNNAMRRFNSRKEAAIQLLENHDVSKELEEGPMASSKFLKRGNLFSLLGFYSTEKPLNQIREILWKNLKINTTRPRITQRSNILSFYFHVQYPKMEEIYAVTPMNWSNRSWVKELESGISGLAQYIYFEFLPGSRSSTGLQGSRKNVGIYSNLMPIPYITEILAETKRIMEK